MPPFAVTQEGHFLLLVDLSFIFSKKYLILHLLILLSPNVPACGNGSTCKDKLLPLDSHHACSLCDIELHGICGCFYNKDSIKCQNICLDCKIALEHKNHDLKLHGFPPLPSPMTPREAAE
jgi:hypothetical protein